MNREIKFRGKSKNTDKQQMIYGRGYYRDESDRLFILQDEPIPMTPIQVKEIMQFTGLKDCTGKEIYEGDLLQRTPNGYEPRGIVQVIYDDKYAMFRSKDYIGSGSLYDNNEYHKECKIVGNIYENGNLLKN